MIKRINAPHVQITAIVCFLQVIALTLLASIWLQAAKYWILFSFLVCTLEWCNSVSSTHECGIVLHFIYIVSYVSEDTTGNVEDKRSSCRGLLCDAGARSFVQC